ncbi:MAG: glutaredoxin 3 [Mariprofundus sp.]|nr:glutaredoxin 3 [Mariprofundus sp.]
MANIEVYSGDFCPYCVKAKSLLKKKGLEFLEYNVKRDMKRQAEMAERAPGARTIPQIFINDRHVGGCDELFALESRGELNKWLE